MIEIVLKKPDVSNTKSCINCRSFRGAVSWWCINELAVEHRGTSIPGICNCGYWEQARTLKDLSWFERHFLKSKYILVDP